MNLWFLSFISIAIQCFNMEGTSGHYVVHYLLLTGQTAKLHVADQGLSFRADEDARV